MKKLLIIALALILSASAFGQNKIKYGFTSGLELLGGDYLGGETGFNAGFIGELSFANNVYGNASLLYVNRDFFSDDNGAIVVPVHAGYKYQIADKVHLLGEAGPHLGFDFDYLDSHFMGGLGIKLGIEFSGKYRILLGEDVTFFSGGRYNSTIIGFAIFF